MNKLYKSLCYTENNIQPCGKCIWNVTDLNFLDKLSLRDTLGLVISLLTEINRLGEPDTLAYLYCNCKGQTNICTVSSSPVYNYDVNILQYKYIFESWKSTKILTNIDKFKLEEIKEALDMIQESNNLLLVFTVMFNSVESWIQE